MHLVRPMTLSCPCPNKIYYTMYVKWANYMTAVWWQGHKTSRDWQTGFCSRCLGELCVIPLDNGRTLCSTCWYGMIIWDTAYTERIVDRLLKYKYRDTFAKQITFNTTDNEQSQTVWQIHRSAVIAGYLNSLEEYNNIDIWIISRDCALVKSQDQISKREMIKLFFSADNVDNL